MTGASATARGVRRHVDWRHAARLLAEGRSMAETARTVGCSRASVARRLKVNQDFQRLVGRLRDGAGDAEAGRLEALRRTCQDAIETEVRGGNVRVILWLADRLKLITPQDSRTEDDELETLLKTLSPDELSEFEGLKDPS